jgi:hypothetical protein
MFARADNPNVKIREQRLANLHDQLEEFFNDHLKDLGHLVDGNKYDLKFTIEAAPPGPPQSEDDSYIKAVSATMHKE